MRESRFLENVSGEWSVGCAIPQCRSRKGLGAAWEGDDHAADVACAGHVIGRQNQSG